MEGNEDSWWSLWCGVEDLGGALLFHNRHFEDDPVFNHLTRIRTTEADSPKLIERALERFAGHRVQPYFYVSPLTEPPGFSTHLMRRGLRKHDDMKVMVFHKATRPVHREPAKIQGVDEAALDAWVGVFAEAFDLSGSWMPEARRRVAQVLADRHTILYLAQVGAEPAGTLALHSKEGVGGIYCIGTRPRFRGTGVASQLLAQAAQDSREQGNDVLCLQHFVRDRVESFYVKNSFETVFTRAVFTI